MRHIKTPIILFWLLLITAIHTHAVEKDSLSAIIGKVAASKVKVQQQLNELEKKNGGRGNYVITISNQDIESAYPEKVLSLKQKNTRQQDVDKLWDFNSNLHLKHVAELLQNFSEQQGYEYYVVICAIYNYYDDSREQTDFSKLTWSDISNDRINLNTPSATSKGKGSYQALLNGIINKFRQDNSIAKAPAPHLYHFVITAFEPQLDNTTEQVSGRLSHLQGLYWNSPREDSRYEEVWRQFFKSKPAQLAGNNTKGKPASKEEWLLANIKSDQEMLAALRSINEPELLAITDAEKLTEILKKLPRQALAAFNIETRVHLLQVLSGIDLNSDKEQMVCSLIEQTPPQQTDQVIQAMYLTNPFVPAQVWMGRPGTGASGSMVPNPKKGWCLLQCITEETNDSKILFWGNDNYQRLIKSFISLCKNSTKFKEAVARLSDTRNNDLLASRTIFYNYNSFWTKFSATLGNGSTISFVEPKIDRTTSYYSDCRLQTRTELFYSYILSNTSISNDILDPFEPVVFVNQSDLGMLTEIENGQSMFISPALILKYADEKAWNQTATDATMAVIDAASFATGYGEIKAGVTGLRKAWAIMDMANAGINIGMNAGGLDKTAAGRKILDAYNLATGGIAVTRMVSGGVKAVYSLIKNKSVLQDDDIAELLQIIRGNEEGVRSLSDEDVLVLKGLLEKLKAEANARGLVTLEQEADEALGMVRSGGVIDIAKAEQRYTKTYVSATSKPYGLRMTLEEVEKAFGRNGRKIVVETEAKAKEIISDLTRIATGDPVLTGLIDVKTKQIFYGRNLKSDLEIEQFLEDMHPILKERYEIHQVHLINNTLRANSNDIQRAGIPASHSEMVVIDKALKARGTDVSETDLEDFIIHNKNLGGQQDNMGIPKGCPPRCAHCWYLSDGVKVIGND